MLLFQGNREAVDNGAEDLQQLADAVMSAGDTARRENNGNREFADSSDIVIR